MGTQSRVSERHRRTRRDHESETAEDYVEAVADISAEQGRCRVVDLARRFAVSHVTVTRTVARLREAGLVEGEPYGPIELTAKGRKLAAQSKHRHHVVFEFLKAIGVSEPVAAIDAEGIEHHVSRTTLDRLQAVTELLARSYR
jgi:DtxR family manganese transport transcriptional regulator